MRRWWHLVIAALLLGPSACGSGSTASTPSPSPLRDCRGLPESAGHISPAPNVRFVSLTVDHRLRDYRVFQPPSLDQSKPAPLVIVLHGSPIDAEGFEGFIHFDGEATKGGFLEVSPNGCAGFWSYAERGPKEVDEHFIGAVINQVEAQFRIDKQRVFVVAASAGTWVAYRLACDMSDQIAAIASVAGTMRLTDDCKPLKPVSILEMHGTDDRVHPWQGGGDHLAFPVDDVIQRWTTLDRCAGVPAVTQSGITVTSSWKQCQSGTIVRLDKVVGGQHTWFGSALAPVTGEPDANATIWSFFSGLPLRA